MSLDEMSLDELCINTIRTLSIDAVFQADSGHPGAPLGCAAIAYTLWTRFLRCNPKDPAWPDRDRFVLSAGHASALLYSMLHLTGYELPMEEIKSVPPVRQHDARPPGGRLRPRRGDHHRPARAGARQRPSAWPSPSATWPPASTAPTSPSSTTAPSCWPATAT